MPRWRQPTWEGKDYIATAGLNLFRVGSSHLLRSFFSPHRDAAALYWAWLGWISLCFVCRSRWAGQRKDGRLMNQVLFFSFNEFVVSTFPFQLFTLADALLLTLVVLWWLHMFESFLVAACKVVAQFRSLWLGYLTFISSCFVMSVGLERLLFSKNHVAISSTITWITHLNKSVATICRGSSASQIWYYKGTVAMFFQKVSRLKNAARLLFMWGYVCSVGFDIVILHFACFYFSHFSRSCNVASH